MKRNSGIAFIDGNRFRIGQRSNRDRASSFKLVRNGIIGGIERAGITRRRIVVNFVRLEIGGVNARIPLQRNIPSGGMAGTRKAER